MKENKNRRRELGDQWGRAVERALENQLRAEEVDDPHLSNVAGLQVQSGLRGGEWEQSDACSRTPCCQ
ncbi:MAG TPA: hypothetical protein VFD70_10815 [Anaerolineae bacterium]|nr:hypothetical protein [Anaerolineae bacterium]